MSPEFGNIKDILNSYGTEINLIKNVCIEF